MTKKIFIIATATILFLVLAFVPAIVSAESYCFCMSAGADYKICYEAMDDSYDITGYRIASSEDVPIAGSAFVNRDGDIIIGFSQLFSWKPTSNWFHPHGTTNINFSQSTYTSVYYGNSAESTRSYDGSATFIWCPSNTSADLYSNPGIEEGAK